MFKIFLVIIFIIVIYGAVKEFKSLKLGINLNDFGYSETIIHPTVVKIDTLVRIITIHDTIRLPGKIIYVKNDSTGTIDSLAVSRWEPNLDRLSGYLDVSCNLNSLIFTFIPNLEVEETIIEKTIEKPVIIPHPWLRTSAMVGAFGSKDNGILLIGAGIVIKNKLSIYLAALSNEMLGGVIVYNF